MCQYITTFFTSTEKGVQLSIGGNVIPINGGETISDGEDSHIPFAHRVRHMLFFWILLTFVVYLGLEYAYPEKNNAGGKNMQSIRTIMYKRGAFF